MKEGDKESYQQKPYENLRKGINRFSSRDDEGKETGFIDNAPFPFKINENQTVFP